MIIAVDYDGTLVNGGKLDHALIDALRARQRRGDTVILWTCREGELLRAAVDWCKSQDLIFDAVNDNLPERVQQYGKNPRKIGADLYIDDRAYPGVEGAWRDLCQLI